jgi:hypothetical protein
VPSELERRSRTFARNALISRPGRLAVGDTAGY